MKKLCKTVDITDRNFVIQAIQEYLSNKSNKDIKKRADIQRLFKSHKGKDIPETIGNIADDLIDGIKNQNLNLKPIIVSERYDTSSRKMRIIAVEECRQQLYDQIAFKGLNELMCKVGEYQCTCLRNQEKTIYWKTKEKDGSWTQHKSTKIVGRGQEWAMNVVYGWWQDQENQFCVKMDIHHNYASIDHKCLDQYLTRYIKNDSLMWLIDQLIATTPKECMEHEGAGLPIGSVLSIGLDAVYLSQLYHYLMEQCFRVRRRQRKKICNHVLMWMDDIYIFTRSEKDAMEAARRCISYCRDCLKLQIKPDWHLIEKKIGKTEKSYVDCVGFRIYPDHITLRRRNYVKARENLKRGRKSMDIDLARTIMSNRGEIMACDSFRFRRKYHAKTVMRKARRTISKYDRSKIQREAAGRNDQQAGRSDNRADRTQ